MNNLPTLAVLFWPYHFEVEENIRFLIPRILSGLRSDCLTHTSKSPQQSSAKCRQPNRNLIRFPPTMPCKGGEHKVCDSEWRTRRVWKEDILWRKFRQNYVEILNFCVLKKPDLKIITKLLINEKPKIYKFTENFSTPSENSTQRRVSLSLAGFIGACAISHFGADFPRTGSFSFSISFFFKLPSSLGARLASLA